VAVVEAKWPGFVEAFHGFDPQWVAALTPPEVEALAADNRVVRNRAKIEATVSNAAVMLKLDGRPRLPEYLRSHGGFDETVADMKRRFKYWATRALSLLWVVGEPRRTTRNGWRPIRAARLRPAAARRSSGLRAVHHRRGPHKTRSQRLPQASMSRPSRSR